MDSNRYLTYNESVSAVRRLVAADGLSYHWDWERQRIHGEGPAGAWTFRLPHSFPDVPLLLPRSKYDGPAKPSQTLAQYALSLPSQPMPYLLILIQAGHSAIGYFEGGEALHHKVIKKYMVRGNGRAQIGYLGSRGKSKAGSRIRLANSVTFFEDINEKLGEWSTTDKASRIYVSCPVKIQPIWFSSDTPPPFSKDDPRIAKVPLDVQRPDLDQLLHVARQLDAGSWEGVAMDGVLGG